MTEGAACNHNAVRSEMAQARRVDDVPVRSQVLTLALRRTRECLHELTATA